MAKWEEVELFQQLGGRDMPVATVLVPAFLTLPMVLTWGDRCFVLYPDGVYREAYSCPVFTRAEIEEGRQRGLIV